MTSPLDLYRAVWLVDFEYGQTGGEGGPHAPRCVVAHEYKSGKIIRLWLDGRSPQACPYDTDERSLFISFYASAETACHVHLGWPMPERILDLCAEVKCILNGRRAVMDDYLKEKRVGRASLLGSLYHWDLSHVAIEAAEKEEMRDLAIRGGPYSESERNALLDYCETDVVALRHLLDAMLPDIDFHPALFRGRYAGSLGHLEYHGIPIDIETFQQLKENWSEIVDRLIDSERDRFDVFGNRDTDQDKFGKWLQERGITFWPTTASGKLSTGKWALEEAAKIYGGDVYELKELLSAVRQTRLFDTLRVGVDGRNRFMVSPFNSKTSRNQPSSAHCIFGPGVWVRSLIQPPPGHALAYLDFSGQEYAIAGYFSNDAKMIEDYQGDPYLGFAKRVGIVPPNATKESHADIRARLKVCCGLGCIYGAGPDTVARAGQMTTAEATHYLERHREIYSDFWEWRGLVISHAAQHEYMRTPLGWTWYVDSSASATTASNWPMQAAAADILRLATCLATENDIKVVGLLHDAILIESPLETFNQDVEATSRYMKQASREVLGVGELKVDVDRIIYPERFIDEKRGRPTWEKICRLSDEVRSEKMIQCTPRQAIP